MRQATLATAGFERYGKPTRRAGFLARMERVVPWAELCALIEPVYPRHGKGRRPVGLERMLRIYFLQQWFNLSDPAAEEALYNSVTMRRANKTALPAKPFSPPPLAGSPIPIHPNRLCGPHPSASRLSGRDHCLAKAVPLPLQSCWLRFVVVDAVPVGCERPETLAGKGILPDT